MQNEKEKYVVSRVIPSDRSRILDWRDSNAA